MNKKVNAEWITSLQIDPDKEIDPNQFDGEAFEDFSEGYE